MRMELGNSVRGDSKPSNPVWPPRPVQFWPCPSRPAACTRTFLPGRPLPARVLLLPTGVIQPVCVPRSSACSCVLSSPSGLCSSVHQSRPSSSLIRLFPSGFTNPDLSTRSGHLQHKPNDRVPVPGSVIPDWTTSIHLSFSRPAVSTRLSLPGHPDMLQVN